MTDEQKEPATGWHDMPAALYHSDAETWHTASAIKLANEDLALYEYKYLGDSVPDTKTPSMVLGSVVHAIMAGEPVYTYDRGIRRGKEYEQWKESLPAGSLECTEKEYMQAERMTEALWQHPLIDGMKNDCEMWIEQTYRWYDRVLDVPCQMRPDVYLPEQMLVIDYKTCSKFSERDIRNQMIKYSYHLQAAHYLEGVEHYLGHDPHWEYSPKPRMVFAFVETSPPHRVAIVQIENTDIQAAQAHRIAVLDRLLDAKQHDQFSSKFCQEITTVTLPYYVWDYTDEHGNKYNTKDQLRADANAEDLE